MGVEAVRRTVRAAIELNIPYLTLFSFSSENWARPVSEIDDLMGLLKRFIRRDSEGQFKESDDVGHSLAQDQKRDSKTRPKRGEGDKGDR